MTSADITLHQKTNATTRLALMVRHCSIAKINDLAFSDRFCVTGIFFSISLSSNRLEQVKSSLCIIKDNVSTCLSLYEHQCVLSGSSFKQLLRQTTPTGLQQPEDIQMSN